MGGAAGRWFAGGGAGRSAGGALGGGAIGLVAKLVVTAEATVAVVEAGVAALATAVCVGGIISVTSLEVIARGGGGGGGIRRAAAALGEFRALGECCVSVINPVIGERWAVLRWARSLRVTRKGSRRRSIIQVSHNRNGCTTRSPKQINRGSYH